MLKGILVLSVLGLSLRQYDLDQVLRVSSLGRSQALLPPLG